MQPLDHLNRIRKLEAEQLACLLPRTGRVLDFGAGTGQQSKVLADLGFDIVAIDLPSSVYAHNRLFPIRDYDGRNIPLENSSVDAVLSSNVLYLVKDLRAALSEMRRVLRVGGVGVHVLPTSRWRFWSFVTGLTDSAKTAILLPIRIIRGDAEMTRSQLAYRDARRIVRGIIPPGMRERWTFSERSWLRNFRENGFDVLEIRPLGLFYTGTELFGKRVPMRIRRKLCRFFGSATKIYVTAPTAL